MFGWLKRTLGGHRPEVETRASASGFTHEVMAARESYLAGRTGIADLTATAQTCITLWENGLGLADVTGTTLLDHRTMAVAGRSLALRGEAVFLITEDGLIPASDWELATRNGRPTAYRLGISEAGGGISRVALAGEVLHFRIGADSVTPYYGQSPLRRARLTAGLLQAVETALSEAFDNMPLGSQIVPFPESSETDLETLGQGFRGKRGRVLLRESVQVSAAGGPTPTMDWRPQDVTPDLQKAMTKETLDAARDAICAVFGVLPAMFNSQAQGPLVREAQRHLAMWMLQPMAVMIAEEATDKLGLPVLIDTVRPLQAFDAGGRARALATIVEAMGNAKALGLSPGEVGTALKLVDWQDA